MKRDEFLVVAKRPSSEESSSIMHKFVVFANEPRENFAAEGVRSWIFKNDEGKNEFGSFLDYGSIPYCHYMCGLYVNDVFYIVVDDDLYDRVNMNAGYMLMLGDDIKLLISLYDFYEKVPHPYRNLSRCTGMQSSGVLTSEFLQSLNDSMDPKNARIEEIRRIKDRIERYGATLRCFKNSLADRQIYVNLIRESEKELAVILKEFNLERYQRIDV